MKSEKKVKDYLIAKIREKAEANKELLTTLYDNILDSIETLNVAELVDLNDLGLLLNYLDYVNSIKNKKVAESLLKQLDISFDFTELKFKDKTVIFNAQIVASDRSEAKEEAFFNAHSNSGGFVFEDYDEEEEEGAGESGEEPVLDDEEDKLDSLVRELEDAMEFGLEEDTDEDDPFAALESMLDDINSEAEKAEDDQKTEQEKEGEEQDGYDFFNDFTDDSDDADESDYDDDFDGLQELSDWDNEGEVITEEDKERLSMLTGDKEEDEPLDESEEEPSDEDKEFKDKRNSELEAKWGMFTSIIPGWTLESYETMSLTSLATLIRRGMLRLPEDKSLLTDEMIDFLLQQQILTERPVKKTAEEEEEEKAEGSSEGSKSSDGEIDDSDLMNLEHDNPNFEFTDVNEPRRRAERNKIEEKKPLFRDNIASHRADAADEMRKKLGAFGKAKISGLFGKMKQQKSQTQQSLGGIESDDFEVDLDSLNNRVTELFEDTDSALVDIGISAGEIDTEESSVGSLDSDDKPAKEIDTDEPAVDEQEDDKDLSAKDTDSDFDFGDMSSLDELDETEFDDIESDTEENKEPSVKGQLDEALVNDLINML